MSIKKLRSSYKTTIEEMLEKSIAARERCVTLLKEFPTSVATHLPDEEARIASLYEQLIVLPQFLVKEYTQSQAEPILLSMPFDEGKWLYQDQIYEVDGVYTKEEKKLLILEFADKERQKFERLAVKFSQEQTDHIKHERNRIPENVRIEVWRRDQGTCSGCGSRVNLEYDHIVPVSRGGSNTARNVELLCEACIEAKEIGYNKGSRREVMTMTLDLAPETEAYLREKAAREGQAVEAVAQALLMQAIQTDAQSQRGGGAPKLRHQLRAGGGAAGEFRDVRRRVGAPGDGCL